MAKNFKFQVQDSFFGIFFFQDLKILLKKRIALSEKKPPLGFRKVIHPMYTIKYKH